MAISRRIRCGSFTWNLRDITVEPAFFLYIFAGQLSLPAMQALTYYRVCLHTYNDSFCDQLTNATFQREHPDENDDVQAVTSYWILLTNVSMIVPAIFSAVLFLGSYGDKKGRKFPVLLPVVGFLLQSCGNLVNAVYPKAPLGLLLVGSILNGVCGGLLAMIMAVFSYITHVAPPGSKTVRIGIVESMTFLAGTLGAFVSGVMLDGSSFTFVFAFSLGLLLLAVLFVALWLEDIKPTVAVAVPTYGTWNYTSLKEICRFVREPRGPRVRLVMFLLILGISILTLCVTGEMDVLLLFLRREPLAWSQTLFGDFKGMENLLKGLALIVALPLLKGKLHVRDTWLVIVGMLSKVANMVTVGLAKSTGTVFVAGVLGMAQGLPSVGMRSMMSGLVHRDEQGRLFSLVAVAESLSAVVASLLFNGVYAKTLHFFPGFALLMGAGFGLIALCIAIYLHKTGASELCNPPPYTTMPEVVAVPDAEGESSSGSGDNEHQSLLNGQQRTMYSDSLPRS